MKCMRSVRAACLLLLPFLILNFAPFAYSEERPSIFIEDLTWTELRDEIGTGNPHYQGSGGVQLSSFLQKAAFAIRLGDFDEFI